LLCRPELPLSFATFEVWIDTYVDDRSLYCERVAPYIAKKPAKIKEADGRVE
jgi:hypothetical protein